MFKAAAQDEQRGAVVSNNKVMLQDFRSFNLQTSRQETFLKILLNTQTLRGKTASSDVFSFLWISDQMSMRSRHEVSSLRIKEWGKQISKSARAENRQSSYSTGLCLSQKWLMKLSVLSLSFRLLHPPVSQGKKKLWVQHVHTRFTLPKCHKTFALNGRGVNVLLQTARVSCYYSKK